jgi:hypothetical protein
MGRKGIQPRDLLHDINGEYFDWVPEAYRKNRHGTAGKKALYACRKYKFSAEQKALIDKIIEIEVQCTRPMNSETARIMGCSQDTVAALKASWYYSDKMGKRTRLQQLLSKEMVKIEMRNRLKEVSIGGLSDRGEKGNK